ncbi:gas vesicle protein GvpO [uncultured Sulfitobacter sp.]|uniref:gas vesicle protein GvpO n=1 Tax=uncultured Sulfitobacter sp. TaxID=191468 RepID=UPI00261770A4|nr:gas vesicle protein GvpO [uncultured Sulfitobacter sp.]
MKHEAKVQFDASPAKGDGLSMMDAIGRARTAIGTMTGLDIDAVVHCAKSSAEGASWAVTLDVVESRARMGDNDLLSAYEVQLDAAGELLHFERLRRYHREDRMG